MATNPMQRQARNSFLLGIVVALLIAALIVAFLFLQMKKLKDKVDDFEKSMVSVFVLNQDVKSGQELTLDMFTQQKISKTSAPQNSSDIINSFNNSEKKFIAKIDLFANSVVTNSMIDLSDAVTTDDIRKQEYNVVVLPTDLADEDYIDIRLMLPNGQDFIVVSKKSVKIPMANGEYLDNTMWVNLAEEETLAMSCAIVEAFKIEGSKLYATKYTDAGVQNAATPTYIANKEVVDLINKDPNIATEAKNGLVARYTEGLNNIRNQNINSLLTDPDAINKVKEKMDESIVSTQESRKGYLQGLSGTATN